MNIISSKLDNIITISMPNRIIVHPVFFSSSRSFSSDSIWFKHVIVIGVYGILWYRRMYSITTHPLCYRIHDSTVQARSSNTVAGGKYDCAAIQIRTGYLSTPSPTRADIKDFDLPDKVSGALTILQDISKIYRTYLF